MTNNSVDTSENEFRDELIKNICSEEQLASIQAHDPYNPKIEALAKILKIIAGTEARSGTLGIEKKDIKRITNMIGIRVFLVPQSKLPDGVFGGLFGNLLPDGELEYAIAVSKDISLERKMFAIGHEIGHFILEHEPMIINDALDSFSKFRVYLQNEYDANYVAGALLLDEDSFKTAFQSADSSFENLASRFNYT